MPNKLSFVAACCALLLILALDATEVSAIGIHAANSIGKRSDYTDQIIVRLKDEPFSAKRQSMSVSRARALSLSAGVQLQAVRPVGATAQVMKLPQALPLAEVEKIAGQVALDPNVVYAEPDRRKYPHRVPADPRYVQQWYLFESAGGINAASAWDVTVGSSSIVVGVIDEGVVFANGDLQGRLLTGYDFISADPVNDCAVAGCPFATANDGNGRDPDASDPGDWITVAEAGKPPFQGCSDDDSSWHGTHVTGIIGANSDNAIGITGLDWAARLLPVRVLGKCGGYTSDIVDGMRWAAGLSVAGVPANPTPAHVLNLSLGGYGDCGSLEQSAITEILATTRVKAIVTSAGNENDDAARNSPGNCIGVINVGATDRSGNRAPYSDFGAAVTISAPGGIITASPSDTGANGILSLNNNGTTAATTDAFAFFSGTSAAAPQVTGAISLMLAVNPGLSAADVRSVITSTARMFPAGSNCTTSLCGTGILDVNAVVRRAASISGSTGATSSSGGSSSSGSSGSSSSTTSSGNSSSGGGGGCASGTGPADISLLLLLFAAWLGFYRRKR